VFEQVVGFAERAEVLGLGQPAEQPVAGVVEVGAHRGAAAAGEPAGLVPGPDPGIELTA
jgi:hypothetical protein